MRILLSSLAGELEVGKELLIEALYEVVLKSQILKQFGKIASNVKVTLEALSVTEVRGVIQSLNAIEVVSGKLALEDGGRIEAIKELVIRLRDEILVRRGALWSGGIVIIEKGGGGAIKQAVFESGVLDARGDVTIRAKLLTNRRSDCSVAETLIHQWEYISRKNSDNGKCYRETLSSFCGSEGRIRVGGNFVFDGVGLENFISFFGVEGNVHCLQKANIKNEPISLKVRAEYSSHARRGRGKYVGWCVGAISRQLAICGLSNYGNMVGTDSRIDSTVSSTFYVLGGVYGEFTSIGNINVETKLDNVPLVSAVEMKYIWPSQEAGKMAIAGTESNTEHRLVPSIRKANIVKQLYNSLEKIAVNMGHELGVLVGSGNIRVNPGSDASAEPMVCLKHKPLASCEYGTVQLLEELGVDKKQYPQIFGSADIEKGLIEHGVFELTGMRVLFSEVQEAFLIRDGVDSAGASLKDKGCEQLQRLLKSGLKVKEKYGLEVGKSLDMGKMKDIEQPFAWPVSKTLPGGKQVLALELYLPEETVKRAPRWFGAGMLLGAIEAKIEGNFINTGLTYVNDGAVITAENIGLAGMFIVKSGDLALKASKNIVNVGTVKTYNGDIKLEGTDIYELIAHDGRDVLRTTYKIEGNAYYIAEKSISQKSTLMYISGDLKMKGKDIHQSTTYNTRVVREEWGKKHHLIERTVDSYDMILLVGGDVEIDAEGNYRGSGIKVSSGKDVKIEGEKVRLETTTAYAKSENTITSKKWYGSKNTVRMEWTTSKTARLEITAPGGDVYISSSDCTLEGVLLKGDKPVLKCGQLLEKPHLVQNTMQITSEKKGLFAPKIPILELVKSNRPLEHIKDNTLIGSLEGLLKMEGPLDLLPAMSLISELPSVKSAFNALQASDVPTPFAMVGALLQKYVSASISFGKEKMRQRSVMTESVDNELIGRDCILRGRGEDSVGYISGDIKCSESLYIEFGNVRLSGSFNTVETEGSMSSRTGKIGVGLSGISLSYNYQKGTWSSESVKHRAGQINSKVIQLMVNDRLEIEGAVISGEKIKVKANEVEVKQVIERVKREQEIYGFSAGVLIGWTGTVLPEGSLSYESSLKESQMVKFISGISGNSIEMTTKHLIYNVAALKSEEELNVKADKVTEVPLPGNQEKEEHVSVMAALSVDAEGNMRGSVSGRYKNGDFVMSGGYFSGFMEGIGIIESLFGVKDKKEQESEKLREELKGKTVPFWEGYLRGASVIEKKGGGDREKERLYRALDEVGSSVDQRELAVTIVKKKEEVDKSRRNGVSKALDSFGGAVMGVLHSMNPFREEPVEVMPLLGNGLKECMGSAVCLEGLSSSISPILLGGTMGGIAVKGVGGVGKDESCSVAASKVHEVKRGESLWDIWRAEGLKTGRTWAEFKEDNAHIAKASGSLDKLKPGDKVYIVSNKAPGAKAGAGTSAGASSQAQPGETGGRVDVQATVFSSVDRAEVPRAVSEADAVGMAIEREVLQEFVVQDINNALDEFEHVTESQEFQSKSIEEKRNTIGELTHRIGGCIMKGEDWASQNAGALWDGFEDKFSATAQRLRNIGTKVGGWIGTGVGASVEYVGRYVPDGVKERYSAYLENTTPEQRKCLEFGIIIVPVAGTVVRGASGVTKGAKLLKKFDKPGVDLDAADFTNIKKIDIDDGIKKADVDGHTSSEHDVSNLVSHQILSFNDKITVRKYLENTPFFKEGNKFFKDATGKCKDYKITNLASGNKEMSYFAEAKTAGYGKRYVLELDGEGKRIKEYKDTITPSGAIKERKFIHEKSNNG
ncbi:hypothetical protein EDM53_05480 [Rickettsiales endosymbiont of Peranema trichophorum]|uniref:hemagglutinin repeat-containing protein n=1 Tax=Rickettsiales endosymbiont of Peranema trichophorum TaxID=2486577 RepID=UPI001023C748|nr:hemagglutinin repeat-containing protein [Rickettsiales endosymbiont of Peranema trichophorum]RZI45292.1 hypothetical protein EDM53_05480 [Rickettsiales endosymbiont of Peranema trichophorum]